MFTPAFFTTALLYLGYILIFPGFLFCFVIGLLLCGIDRKAVARMQKRVGPPILQPFYDFFKLCGKETIVPAAASRTTFMLAPLVGLAALVVIQLFIPVFNFRVFRNLPEVADMVAPLIASRAELGAGPMDIMMNVNMTSPDAAFTRLLDVRVGEGIESLHAPGDDQRGEAAGASEQAQTDHQVEGDMENEPGQQRHQHQNPADDHEDQFQLEKRKDAAAHVPRPGRAFV